MIDHWIEIAGVGILIASVAVWLRVIYVALFRRASEKSIEKEKLAFLKSHQTEKPDNLVIQDF